jgi:hypothetical protein
MRLLISLLFVSRLAAQLGGFSVAGQDDGSWPQILSSVGLHAAPAAQASVFVARPATPASASWANKVDSGAFLILEGDSPLARSFGFHPGSKTTQLATLIDIHQPKLPLIFEKPVDVPLYSLPNQARIFTRERWTGAPAVAGFKHGRGAVLWVAAHPGLQGYERFPFLPQAMADLGFEPPFRSNRTWAFFDYSYRTRVDLDYFAAKWRAAGISALHVASWHFYDPDPARDAYLRHLIEACHREGILVYAWLELPHVSEKFWTDHADWREKTALLQDAQLDWRKLMNLANPDCFRAVTTGVRDMIGRFDWDGVNLAELYYESLEGAANPARFTPMNTNVRAAFRQTAGFDPLELWSTRKDAASLRRFLDYRAGLARRMQEDWLHEAEIYRAAKPNLDIVLTHVDDRFDTGMRDAIGADTSQVLPLLKAHDFTFLIEDPATVWNLGPKRYPEIARRYPQSSKLAIDINVVARYQDVYPTRQQTGIELFQLLHLAAGAFPRVALYFENSLLAPDLPLLPAAAAVATRVTGSTIDSDYGIGVHWAGSASVDGREWPVADGTTVWLPAGSHTIKASARAPARRVLSFNGLLRSAASSPQRVELSYESNSRALAVMERAPIALALDGAPFPIEMAGNTLLLPRGHHTVSIQ